MTDTETPIISPDEPTRPPLWKQLAGAIGGAAIALALYASYEVASPALTAWLSIPETPRSDPGEVKIQNNVTDKMQQRIARRAQAIAEEFSERPEHPVAESEEVSTASVSSSSDAAPIAAVVPAPILPTPEELAPEAIQEEPVAPKSEPIAQAKPVTAEPVVASKAPALPSSGVGVWLMGFLSILVAIGWKFHNWLHKEIMLFP